MPNYNEAASAIANVWLRRPGAYVLVDGQYGSTGKGLMAGVIAQASMRKTAEGLPGISHVTTNAGPNSGHTAYLERRGHVNNKVMTQQLPIASIALAGADHKWEPVTYLNGGAIIDPTILNAEQEKHQLQKLVVHPCATIIQEFHRTIEASDPGIVGIASTGKGVGAALSEKILRTNNTAARLRDRFIPSLDIGNIYWDWTKDIVFVETAQGFSLGINSHQFHPHTTSRECTVMQAIADARIPAPRVRGVCATYRTFPIRVGNTNLGKSGACYEDQVETSWEVLGLEPELTSVTKRVRRVFTWSRLQFKESVAANEPDIIFLNFMNYLKDEHARQVFVHQVLDDYRSVIGLNPALVLLGYGPRSEDVRVW